MKFNITTYELWFWRIGIVIALFLSVIGYSDNRKQDSLVFKTIDIVEVQTSQINQIIKSILFIQTTVIGGLNEINDKQK